jgi:ribosome-binding factor A
MDSTRLNRLSQLMIEELGTIFQRFSQRMFKGVLVSVTKVRISPDLSVAKVYISIFPSNESEVVMETVAAQQGVLKRELTSVLGRQLRKMPDLKFYVDDSLDYEDNIEKLLRGEGDNPII